jgi:hypothetical protein
MDPVALANLVTWLLLVCAGVYTVHHIRSGNFRSFRVLVLVPALAGAVLAACSTFSVGFNQQDLLVGTLLFATVGVVMGLACVGLAKFARSDLPW